MSGEKADRGGASLAAAEALVERIRGEIPLTVAMALAVEACDGQTLRLRVPLAPNINDKGTAFAGSITSLGAITGWCLLTLWGEAELGPCQVAIYDAHFRFHKPLRGDFTASVTLPPAGQLQALRESVLRKGKGRAALTVALSDSEGEAAVLEAAYSLWRA